MDWSDPLQFGTVACSRSLQANIIPDYAAATFFVRSLKISQLDELKPRVEKCFEAAAVATGCKVKFSWKDVGVTKGKAYVYSVAN
jgi:metal-dependent amidase/aminoacylase/carboxypeptidase family protein